MKIIFSIALLFVIIGIVFTEFKGINLKKWLEDCLEKHKGDAKRERACQVSNSTN